MCRSDAVIAGAKSDADVKIKKEIDDDKPKPLWCGTQYKETTSFGRVKCVMVVTKSYLQRQAEDGRWVSIWHVAGKLHNQFTDLAFAKIEEEEFTQTHLDSLKEHCAAGDIDVPENWREVGCTFASHLTQDVPNHGIADDEVEDIW